LTRYRDLPIAFGGLNIEKAKNHWVEFGIKEKRNNFCKANQKSCYQNMESCMSMLLNALKRSKKEEELAELARSDLSYEEDLEELATEYWKREEEELDELLDFLL
jgi:L-arabinose isomerase